MTIPAVGSRCARAEGRPRVASAAALGAAIVMLVTFTASVQAQKRGSAAAAPSLTAADSAAARASLRASWLGDRLPLQAGDVLTVVVDEQTAAHERVGRSATGNRSMRAGLNALINGSSNQATITSGINNDSRDDGEAQRQGDLTAVLTVRVTSVAPNGVARIEGSKQVAVDGRAQIVSLKGFVRAEDVSATNEVLSGHIADAVITYKGKTIGPRTGIVGKLLGMLWP